MTTLLLILLAIFLPPLPVAIKDGVRLQFCVNLALYLFAIALAIWVICTTERRTGGHRTWVLCSSFAWRQARPQGHVKPQN